MGDMGDDFRAWNKLKKEKKASNLEYSTDLLIGHEIIFESKNTGVHLIVDAGHKGLIDFYPSTGKWIPRETGKHQRGVKKLINYIGQTQ